MSNIIRHGRFLLLTLVLSALILPGAAVAQDPEPGASEGEGVTGEPIPVEEKVPDQIIMKFKEEADSADKADARSDEGLEKKEDLALINAEVDKVEGQSVEEAISDLNNRPDVEYAVADDILQPHGYTDESRFGDLWGLHNTGQTINGSTGLEDVDVNAPEASAVTQGGGDLIVAVIDDGVDFSHPDLRGREWKNPGESGDGKETNGIDDDGNGYVDDVYGWDFHFNNNTIHDAHDYHGTHVAGTIAASANGDGVVGVAPNVKIMALKFLGPRGGATSNAIKAIDYLVDQRERNGVDVRISNNSWGGDPYNQALKDAIEASGMLFVASAGNDGEDNDTDSTPNYPASFDSPNILSVAALNNQGNLAGFSSYGATSVDISAPGASVLSSIPDRPDLPAVALSSIRSSGRAVTTGFGVEEIGDETGRASFMKKAFEAVGRGSQQVVLVDDDASDAPSSFGFQNVRPEVRAAIRSATSTDPQVINVPYGSSAPVTASQLSGKTVVWATGQASLSAFDPATGGIARTLTPADRNTLTRFLDPVLNPGGGKLVLTGRDALFLNENDSFVTSTLGLTVQSDINRLRAFNGSSGTKFDGESYNLNGATANSNRHDVLTPTGSAAATQGVYPDTPPWDFLNGTSMAAPHATGAATLAASLNPALLGDPAALKSAVMNGGKQSSATGGKTVTGDIVDAFGTLKEADKKPPEGTVLINDGARKTKVVGVTLALSASDPEPGSGVGWVRFRNEDGDWSDWEPYEPNKEWEWTLSDGKRDKTVYVQFKDRVGNESAVVRDTIRKISSH